MCFIVVMNRLALYGYLIIVMNRKRGCGAGEGGSKEDHRTQRYKSPTEMERWTDQTDGGSVKNAGFTKCCTHHSMKTGDNVVAAEN